MRGAFEVKEAKNEKKRRKFQKNEKLFGKIKIMPDLCGVERKFANYEFLP